MKYREKLADAAIEDIKRQHGPEFVERHGTSVQIEQPIRLVRIIEAVMRVAFDDEALQAAVAHELAAAMPEAATEEAQNLAIDVLTEVRGWILGQLDPLP